MIQTRWHKVLIDLWKNRSRTLIVALAIAVGVYAVGVVLNAGDMVVREYRSDQDGALMASAVVQTTPFDEGLAERIAEIPGVAAAEGRSVVRTRAWAAQPAAGGTEAVAKQTLVLVAVPDFTDMQVDALTPIGGAWPPAKREVILERLALEYLGVEIGQSLTVELEDGTERTLTVAGTAHDAQQLSPDITGEPAGYVTAETMAALGLDDRYTELRIRVAEHSHDAAHIQAIVDQVEDQLNRTGRPLLGRRIITESIADPFINTIVLILSTFGILILLLSGFLVVNAITALITQQIPQIGVMKLVGARRWQIVSLYVATVLAYGLIAIAVGIPLAIVTAQLLMKTIVSNVLNVLADSLAAPPHLLLLQAAVGLLLPLVAGLAPVLKGTRVTTQRALNDAGTSIGAYGRGWIEGLVGRLQKLVALRRPILLAIRNTLRHKGRLAQTLIVLVFATALFVSVLSVWSSVDATLDSFMRFHGYDVAIGFEQPYRIARLEEVARGMPGVVATEGWSRGHAVRSRPDGSNSDGLPVYAIPAGTAFMNPQVTAGQWLPGPGANALVVNSEILDDEPDLHVGADVVLDISGREATWHVVGVVPTESRGPALYVNLDDYAYETRTVGQATYLMVATDKHDAASQREMATLLRERFDDRQLAVDTADTTQSLRAENRLIFSIIVAFLALMALLLAGVGGLGLTTTMSINILERVREIGVLRAIGASNLAVQKIVLAEGVAMGVLSWLLGIGLSFPISRFMSEQLGLALIQVPLTYQYSPLAAAAWFLVLQIVAVVASLGPARKAVRLTVREVLAYE